MKSVTARSAQLGGPQEGEPLQIVRRTAFNHPVRPSGFIPPPMQAEAPATTRACESKVACTQLCLTEAQSEGQSEAPPTTDPFTSRLMAGGGSLMLPSGTLEGKVFLDQRSVARLQGAEVDSHPQ